MAFHIRNCVGAGGGKKQSIGAKSQDLRSIT
jgi:hypothetical protein